MIDAKTETKTISKTLNKELDDGKLQDMELRGQYNWFYQNFLHLIQNAGDDFFSEFFSFKLVSLSKNVNVLFQGDDYFVTKIRINKDYDVFFRCSEESIKIILDRLLGENKKFNLSNITELEVKIISSFNDYLYQKISPCLLSLPQKKQKRKNFDTIHLTLFIKDNLLDSGAKIIISLPQILLSPTTIDTNEANFDISDFKTSKLDVNILVGTTKFPLKELKNLEKEDIVVFENSNIHLMKLIYGGYRKKFKVSPNPGIITSTNQDNRKDNGGHKMEENSLSQSLWDNIQVEMGAEFEKVKITLGELKNIEQGLVLDISSVYNNKISLKVENKIIAAGELVIINDRYGVRIDEVFSSEKDNAQQILQNLDESPEEEEKKEEEHQQELVTEKADNTDEEFDYSDFELDDQDI